MVRPTMGTRRSSEALRKDDSER
ncbi:MAG: hypothetical protein JWL99_2627, partial [Streptomyces oryziradicis]|nr:hypothetical protein [Actinacidiphila oryziradicis]